jgi:putative oxidoreductase
VGYGDAENRGLPRVQLSRRSSIGRRAMMPAMRYVTVALRSLLGLIFLASGLNGFLHRFPNPAMLEAVSFFSALLNSHYMLPLLCTTEVVGGALLLSGFLVPLGLAILAPVVVNIFFFHLFLAPEGLPLAITVIALELFLTFQYRAAFAGVFSSPAL